MSELDGPIKRYAYLVSRHDTSYEYSDDPRWYHAGRSERDVLSRLETEINRPCVTTAIWNDAVRRKFAYPHCEHFARTPKGWRK